MVKFTSSKNIDKNDILGDVMAHYQMWTEDNDIRLNRKNGWNNIIDAYWGKLPDDWPYINKVVDPRIRTTIIEKTARMLNSKLRGRLVPREGGDVLKARINNALLDFQWDKANDGGTMLEKWGIMDSDTRLFGSCFGLVKWKKAMINDDLVFNGNEFYPLDIRDVGLDPTCDHVRNAKWVQVREWIKVEDLENINDNLDEPKYKGVKELLDAFNQSQNRRDNAWQNRVLYNKGLTDRVGEDKSFPIIELVTEYRVDRWITFSPKYKVIVRDIENPYDHKRIPVIQLRYYQLNGDPLGESEVEPVLPIWKAIQATVCGFLDSQAAHIKPPLKVIEGAVRIETIVYGPEAQWLMDRPDAVQEVQSSGDALRYFQTSYTSLVSAFNTAMGELSQGVSAIDPNEEKKTATEIKYSAKQQNSRDQSNQTRLSEALQDMMSMWLSNNKQFLFENEKQSEYILRIVGTDLFNYFKRAGLDDFEVPNEAMSEIGNVINEQGGDLSDDDLVGLIQAGEVPKYPVVTNKKTGEVKPKMRVNDMGDEAELSLVPEDLDGLYDYIPSVKSMAAGSEIDLVNARINALETITTNQGVSQMLQAEGYKPKIKELLVNIWEEAGMSDAERFFEKIENQPMIQGQPSMQQGMPGQMGGQPNPQIQEEAIMSEINGMMQGQSPQQQPLQPQA